ncbi:MAG: peptide ABC transporter substrate-binding protein [Candidatus Eremiobacteraeota bacterium]|nr:peptide ABC transporter substrate-binding protein [Candidatus Eremiobacteraeota bacterium]
MTSRRGPARSIVAAIAACCALAGCSQRAGSPAGPPHVLRIAYAGDPNSLVPLVAIDAELTAIDTLFCQTLVGLDADNKPIPILLTRIPSRANGDVSPDGKRITYRLRRGVRFADGVEFTSADVVFTYQAVLDPRNRAVTVEPYRTIVSMQTPDPYTVVVLLRRPWNAAVGEILAEGDYIFGILPKHAFTSRKVLGTPWEDAPFGTGPFRVKEWVRGDRIVFVPNPYYRPKPKLAQIVLQIFPNLNSNFVALRSGAVDVGNLTPENLAEAAELPNVRILRIPDNGTNLLYLNTKIVPTNDVRVRRAIAYSIDYAALANAWKHAYDPATGFLPPPIVRWKGAAIPAYPHDLAAAGRELDAAGWRLENGVRTRNGVPMTGLIAVSAENPTEVRMATVLQSQLAAAGMHFELKTDPVRVWFSPQGLLRNGKAALMTESWVGGMDPEQSLNLRCSQAVLGDSNHSYYCSPQFEALANDQAVTADVAQRWRDFDAMQRLVHDDVPVIPLYYERLFRGVSTRVTGYALNMLWLPVNAENWDAR